MCVRVKGVGGHLRSYIDVTKIEDFDFTNVFQKGLSQSIQGWNQTVDTGVQKYFNSFVRIFKESVKNDGVPIIHRHFQK